MVSFQTSFTHPLVHLKNVFCLSSSIFSSQTAKYQNRHIIKFADESVVLSLEGEELGHGPVVDDLNVANTKDMIIDYGK